jgi:antitoxin HicB
MQCMKHYTYTIEIHPADTGETGYWVSVPALPGCFTQGDTYEEALVNAEEAIIGHLEALAKAGQSIPHESAVPSKLVIGVGLNLPVAS